MSNPVPRLRRLLSIIPMIRRRGEVSLKELQNILGVSKRELTGDLNAIMLCGVPPYLPNDYISVFIDGDVVSVDYADHFARPARLTLQEALALRLAIGRLEVPADGPLYEAYIELLEALDRLVLGANMASLEGRIESARSDATAEKLVVIDEAVAARRTLRFRYYSASSNEVAERRVRPYGRGDRRGNQYLVGFCEARQDVRSFRLDRIDALATVPDAPPFAPPQGFELHRFLSDIGKKSAASSVPVRLRFDAAIARVAEEDFAEERVESGPGGDIVVSTTCGSTPWAVSQCLLYGEEAELLEPVEARAELVARLERFLDQP